MENIQNKALEEVKAFLERSGEKPEVFIAKVQIFENVMTSDLEEGEVKFNNEVSIVLLAKTPQGLQVAYNNVIAYENNQTEEEIFEAIEKAFPTAEEIEEARAKAAKEAEAKAKFQEQIQNINPAELAKLAQEQVGIPEGAEPVTEGEDQEPVDETK